MIEIACQVVHFALGNQQVDISPIDQTTVEVNWSETCQMESRYVVLPRQAADVSKAMRVISFLGTKFAVHSGGHSPNPGSSSIGSEGILIDLQRSRAVSLSCDRSDVTVGPGLC
ncbi:hypothetical protein SMACR_08149 [Sordaria macrospora]|uniref:WGS project CABT00000000 data, contig 2.3 n=2 Tax=Sordaria macrospora TaxID=5147 RepID=F7VQ22_SORMK|nr:uncharacterized protein SMAC_08149 [Sordaria macrospora k-hell]KAA8628193.1 hypothetical protein SMACR_08149 [Sordaria macrospora]WPJ64994.1 hypothetical protein SMAC4_08149 [Sordaria macrospora]CCC07600.1 unnamed protein product [Sordaria macrospora k-hell]